MFTRIIVLLLEWGSSKKKDETRPTDRVRLGSWEGMSSSADPRDDLKRFGERMRDKK